MREMGINGANYDSSIQFRELREPIIERQDFRWTHKCAKFFLILGIFVKKLLTNPGGRKLGLGTVRRSLLIVVL